MTALPAAPEEPKWRNRRLMVATSGHVLRDLLDRLDLGRNP